jgi:hypothetical protein
LFSNQGIFDPMWQAKTEFNVNRNQLKLRVELNNVALTYQAVVQLWRDSCVFRTFFAATLRDAPFAAFRWETPALCLSSRAQVFECMLIDAPELLVAPNSQPFAAHFRGAASADVVSFSNLRKDALLVVPTAHAQALNYAHLAAFLRHAPMPQQDRFWQVVGEQLSARLSHVPVWLNTAGAGVAWLHMRLDSSPKYYRYYL